MRLWGSSGSGKTEDNQPLLPSRQPENKAYKTSSGRTVTIPHEKSTTRFAALRQFFSRPESKSVYERKVATQDFRSYYTKPKINTSGFFNKRTTFNAKAAVSHLNCDQINKRWTASVFSSELKNLYCDIVVITGVKSPQNTSPK